MTRDYQDQVEIKIRLVTQELEKLYELIERHSDIGVYELIRAHREIFVGMNVAYMTYIKELKKAVNPTTLELPTPESPSTKYGGNS